jgi:endonuclease/exonuclease/phosphatase family metal-dependent hydrolase
MKTSIFYLTASLSIAACSHAPSNDLPAGGVVLMTYNVENLFDTKKDNQYDTTYLPVNLKQTSEQKEACGKMENDYYRKECLTLDWSEAVLKRKLERLTDVVLQVNGGHGPDILNIAEIENKNVLEMWNKNYLAKANYQTAVLIPGFDKRGINVALLSRFPVEGEPQLHRIPYKSDNAEEQKQMESSRGILEVTLKLPDSSLLTVFCVHLPSQGNPSKFRKQAVDFINELQSKLPEGRMAYVAGDFNITTQEDRVSGYFSKDLSSKWAVSHKIGCKGCEGTHYYNGDKSWSFLDAMVFTPNLIDGKSPWRVLPESIQVPHSSRYQTSRFMTPARFDENSPVGASDHWPMTTVIVPTKQVSLNE